MLKHKKLIFLTILLISSTYSFSQIGGSSTYSFLNLTNSARIAALGGNFLAIKDNDLTLTVANPSLLGPDLNNHLAFSFVDHYADINYGFASYSHTFKKVGSFAASMQYINYGKFLQADESGQTYGNFNAGEYALTIGWGRSLDKHFFIGSNLKFIYSGLEAYHSFGIAVDVAGTYFLEKNNFAASIIFKNIGRQLVYYTPGNNEKLPFEIQLGISKRFAHLPLNFSILYNHIEKFDLTYSDPNNPAPVVDPLTGDSIKVNKFEKFGDKLMRHFVVGIEFNPIKALSIRLGYNYLRRQELKVETKKGLVGFTFGIGLKIAMFNFSYARAINALAGQPNYITISTNISAFTKKNKPKGK